MRTLLTTGQYSALREMVNYCLHLLGHRLHAKYTCSAPCKHGSGRKNSLGWVWFLGDHSLACGSIANSTFHQWFCNIDNCNTVDRKIVCSLLQLYATMLQSGTWLRLWNPHRRDHALWRCPEAASWCTVLHFGLNCNIGNCSTIDNCNIGNCSTIEIAT